MYIFDDDDDSETIGEAMARSRERESRGRRNEDRDEYAVPTFEAPDDVHMASTSAAAAAVGNDDDDMTEEDRDYLEWQASSDPLGPVLSPDDPMEREARSAERDGDVEGARAMRTYGRDVREVPEPPMPAPTPRASRARDDGFDMVISPEQAEADAVPYYDDEPYDMVVTTDEAESDADTYDAASAIVDDYDMSPLAALEGAASEPFDMVISPEVAAADEAALSPDAEVYGYATDEDPTYPAAGYPLDDNEAVEASMGIDDDELAEAAEPFDMVITPEQAEADVAAFSGPFDMEIAPEDAEWDAMMAEADGAALGDPYGLDEAMDAPSPVEDHVELLGAPGGSELASPYAPPAKVPTRPGEDPMALDAGLPTEDDIRGARVGDAVRRPFAVLGNAILAAYGRAPHSLPSSGARLEDERREGIRNRTAAKGATAAADRRAGMEAAAAERLAQIRNTPSELEVAAEARRTADAERRAAIDTRRLDIDERRVEGTEAERAREAADRDARVNPASDLSRAAQARLRMELDAMSTSPRLRVVADAFREGLDGMSVADVERIESSSLLRPFLNRDGGSGSGGGAVGAAGMSRADRAEVLIRAAVERGMEEDVARATLASLGAEAFSRSILGDAMMTHRADATARRRADATAAANEVIPGVPARAGIDLGAPEARGIRQRVERYRDGWIALNEIDRIAREHGAAAVVTPEIRAEIEPYMLSLISLGAAVQNSGTLNAGERPIIEATLPDPSSLEGTTLGGFTGSLRGWRNRLRQATGAAISVVAPGARNREAAEYWLTTGEVYEEPEPAGGGEAAPRTVRVRDRVSGAELDIPADVWESTPEDVRREVEVVR